MEAIEERAVLPDGRHALVRVGPLDSYIPPNEQDTIGVEVVVDGETAAALNSVLEPDDDAGARRLAEAIVTGLESGELEPTAASIEPLTDQGL